MTGTSPPAYGAALRIVTAFALAIFALAGCATTAPPKTVAAESPAALAARAQALIEEASPESLKEAAGVLSSADLAGSPEAATLAAAGNLLFLRLYPEAASPFPVGTPPSADDGAGVSDFMAKVVPAFVLLDARGAPEADLASLKAGLEAADLMRPDSVLPPYLLGLLAQVQGGDASEARARYEECLRRAPTFYPAAARIADIIIAADTAAAELPRLEQLASLLPSAPLRFAALARAELAGGQPQRAADAAAQGLLSAPDDPQFVMLRAKAFEAMGNWYQASHLLDVLLMMKPDEPDAILMKARLLHEKEANDEEAVSMLLDAETRFPSDPSFPELRGSILLSSGKTDEGIAALTKALSLEPARVSTLSLLLGEAARQKQWTEASSLLAKIPDRARTPEQIRIGWQIATGLGDHDQAIAFARELAVKTGGAEPLVLEARSQLAAGRPAAALSAADRGLAMAGSPQVRGELYAIRAASGSDDPLRDLRSALLEDPENVEALVAISGLLAKQQDYRKAVAYAKQAAALSPGDDSLAEIVRNLESLLRDSANQVDGGK